MMPADIVRYVTMQDVGEDESRGAIACICQLSSLLTTKHMDAPMITVLTHFGSERAMDCDCRKVP
jgi:hypothetical protein